jgi:hypothetical protein
VEVDINPTTPVISLRERRHLHAGHCDRRRLPGTELRRHGRHEQRLYDLDQLPAHALPLGQQIATSLCLTSPAAFAQAWTARRYARAKGRALRRCI